MRIILLTLILLSCVSNKKITPIVREIRINQIGYSVESSKIAVVNNKERALFEVIDWKDGEVVFSSTTSNFQKDEWANEMVSFADFSSFKKKGKYIIRVEGVGFSPPFVIAQNPYKKLHRSLLKGFYFQRASEPLSENYAGKWHRKALSARKCIIWNSSKKRDCSGGWFDAGDYGRYTISTAVSIALLLNSYTLFPAAFDDSLQIPESNNGIPDVLDEARIGLDFLLKMQDEDGGVFHKATSKKFNYYFVPPHHSLLKIYLMPKSLAATYDFVAVMALASNFYSGDYSKKLLQAAKKGWEWASKHRFLGGFVNPPGVETGEYADDSIEDEILWAAVELYKATKEKRFLKKIRTYVKSAKKGLGWQSVGGLAKLAAIKEKKLEKLFADTASEYHLALAKKNTYGLFSTKRAFSWGSNGHLLRDAGMLLLDSTQKKVSLRPVVDYLLGRNSLGQSFVTGFGYFQVKHPHHRPSATDLVEEPIPGLLVGGVNKNLDGIYARDYLKDMPFAKRYIDHFGSYSTNETTIDINAVALFVVSYLVHSNFTLESN